ncbi:MAG: hypothetical protein ACQESU_01795 [Halobacteriota archaeon]
MYREPISRPEPNVFIESGFPNNDLMLPRENETDKIGFRIHIFYGTTVNITEPEAYTKIKGTLGRCL